jgi:hypothetical protein
MVNTGTWNSDFAVFLFLLMMAPIFLAGLANLLKLIINVNQDPINITTEAVEKRPEPQVTFEDIKRAALAKAAQGDKSARDWVTKHVFCPVEEAIKSETKSQKPQIKTKESIIKDALDAMIAVKFDKNEAKRIILRLVKNKTYKDASELFRDAIKRK